MRSAQARQSSGESFPSRLVKLRPCLSRAQALPHPCPQGCVQQRRHLRKSFIDAYQQGIDIIFRLLACGEAETGHIKQHGVARDVAAAGGLWSLIGRI